MEGLDHRDTVTDFILPEETFFDCAAVHLLTTATLDRLGELYPQGRFEARRCVTNTLALTRFPVRDSLVDSQVGHMRRPGGPDSLRATMTPGRHRLTMPAAAA